MANAVNTSTNLWTLVTGDILTTVPICVRKVQMVTTAAADVVDFYTLPGGKTATSDTSAHYTFDVTSTTTITEVGASSWDAALYNDWVLIESCSVSANNGWYLLSATSANNAFVIENGTNALTDGTAQTGTISIYTPVKCMTLTADTYPSSTGTSTPLHHPELDWGDKGRWFDNLSFWEATGLDITINLSLR